MRAGRSNLLRVVTEMIRPVTVRRGISEFLYAISFAVLAFAPLIALRVLFWLVNGSTDEAWWAFVVAAICAAVGGVLRVVARLVGRSTRDEQDTSADPRRMPNGL
jgi:hypothetical protein